VAATSSSSTDLSTSHVAAVLAVAAVVIPAVAYYIGWTYLHFYLQVFGIDISELDFGLETIFIYSWPPIARLARMHWLLMILCLAVLLVLIGWLNGRTWSPFRRVPFVAPVLCLVAAIAVVGFILTPFIADSARHQADEKWTRQGIPIDAIVHDPDPKQSQYVNYRVCADRDGLDLIIADRDGYYMMCRSRIEQEAVVYEVRREFGLVSVRRLKRTPYPNR
jgi:hypothetical protein